MDTQSNQTTLRTYSVHLRPETPTPEGRRGWKSELEKQGAELHGPAGCTIFKIKPDMVQQFETQFPFLTFEEL